MNYKLEKNEIKYLNKINQFGYNLLFYKLFYLQICLNQLNIIKFVSPDEG